MQKQQAKPGLCIRSQVRSGGVTIYGNDNPAFAKAISKQIKAFKDQSIGFEYVNCDRQSCPSMVREFSQFPIVMGYPNETDSWDGFRQI
jgi:hypothetical protein